MAVLEEVTGLEGLEGVEDSWWDSWEGVLGYVWWDRFREGQRRGLGGDGMGNCAYPSGPL